MKKIAIFFMVLVLNIVGLNTFADESAPVKKLKPLFYQGTVDVIDNRGLVMTNTHNQQYSYTVTPESELRDIGGAKITLNDFHPKDRVKVLFRSENPGIAVAIYKLQVLTKAEKAEYSRTHPR